MQRANATIYSKARMKFSLAARRPLHFLALKAVGLVDFLSPSARGWQRAHCLACLSKDRRPSGHSQLLSFVLREIRNKLLQTQEAARQKQEASGKGSEMPPSLNLAPPPLSPVIFH